MAIHEKHLIRPENLATHDNLVIDGVDVSGDWSTFIRTRAVSDYNEDLQVEIAALPGGEYIHRCWQCGSCTNACTVNELNPDFNPRYWIYLIRMGYESELLRDKDIIWQCVSCNKCTSACPRDVVPEGVMKATAHWLELKGHTATSPSTDFDEIFASQVFHKGKIEDGSILTGFMKRSGQPLIQDWLIEMIKGMLRDLPIRFLFNMGWATLFHPKTKNWGKARAAIEEYVAERDEAHRIALKLDKSVDLHGHHN
ncbi:MAG: heterodisulfide reductase subunit C [Hyphomonadaceae bacterium]|nr:MAG: heterodisulfide reductase subunit C [Hyphomonadaceae bacterium]KAF0183607.1 MAG: heterodisulfide reductase subunit C [Hyphomonadaceae bacterium]